MNSLYYSELEKLIGKQVIFTYGEDDQRPDTIFVGEYVGDEDRNVIHSKNFDDDSQLVLWNSEDQWVDPVNYDDSEEFIITSFNRIGVKPFPKII